MRIKGNDMKIQPATREDCVLSTIAMLADVDVAQVHRLYQEYTGAQDIPWCDFQDGASDKTLQDVLNYITNCFGLEDKIIGRVRHKDHTLSIYGAPLDLSGRGQLVLLFEDNAAHSVAYENGMVNDGNHHEAETLQQLKGRYAMTFHGNIVKIKVIPVKTKNK